MKMGKFEVTMVCTFTVLTVRKRKFSRQKSMLVTGNLGKEDSIKNEKSSSGCNSDAV